MEKSFTYLKHFLFAQNIKSYKFKLPMQRIQQTKNNNKNKNKNRRAVQIPCVLVVALLEDGGIQKRVSSYCPFLIKDNFNCYFQAK